MNYKRNTRTHYCYYQQTLARSGRLADTQYSRLPPVPPSILHPNAARSCRPRRQYGSVGSFLPAGPEQATG